MTDYLRLAQERAPQALEQESNPYLSLAREQQTLQQNRARTVLESALKDDPDLAAERLRLSQTAGLPPDVVQRNFEELRVKERARAVDLVTMAQESPVLYRQLVDPTFATTSVDDLDTLKNLERAVGKGVRYVMGADAKGGLPSDLVGAAKTVGLGATVGLGKMAYDVAGTLNDLIGWQSGAQAARGTAQRLQGVMDRYGFQPESSTGEAVRSGLQSAGTNLALLPVGLWRGMYATANAAASAVAGLMATGVGAGAYNKAREQGLNSLQSAVYAIPEGTFEYVFERIPAAKLFGDLAANTGLLRLIGRQTLSEGWTEQVTTLAQDFNEWMNLNQDKTLAEFIQERPEAAYQTFIATLVGVGVQTSTIKGINKIVEAASNQALTFEQDLLQQQLQLAAASTLRARSPEQFRTHIQRVVDANEGAKSEIYVDAEVLNQLPQELLAQLPESVREALPGALETNSTVAIPMADVLTVAPGTELEQILNDNARMRPNAPSRVEAQLTEQFLQQEAERVLQQAADQSAWQQSSQAVQQTILDQLNTAGRFTPDVNEAYATLQANFFSTMAARVGLTPQQLYDRYQLRVSARQPGGQVLNAGIPAPSTLTMPNVPTVEDMQQYSRTESVPLSKVVSFQSARNWDRFNANQGPGALVEGYGDKPLALRLETGEYVIYDGNHRTDLAIQNGETAMDMYVIDVKSYDPAHAGRKPVPPAMGSDELLAALFEQSQQAPRLMAINNLSADNLLFADRMGGIAVPSIGVVTDQAGGVDGFGEITLLGTRDMADPRNEPVFSSDAYTARFPSPEWPKVKSKDAMTLVNEVRATATEFDDRSIVDMTFDEMVNSPNANKVIERWIGSLAAQALFLREQGVDVQPVMRQKPTRSGFPVEVIEALRPVMDGLDMNMSADDILASPQVAALPQAYAEAMTAYYTERGIPPEQIDELVDRRFGFAVIDRLMSDLSSELGTQVVDTYETTKQVRPLIDERAAEFKQWVEGKVLSKFGDPFLKVGGKRAPYTLDNIVKVMTGPKVRGQEKTMTYGAGQVRAASNVQFSDIEQMREAAQQAIKDPAEYNAAKEQSEALLDAYRTAVVEFTKLRNWRGEPDTWEALDGSMRALAKWATGKNRDAASLKAALRAEEFDTARIPDEVITQGIEAGNALLNAPVPYFEAKPQRAVQLNEFAGAVIPANASQQVREVLERNGIPFVEYAEQGQRAQVARDFAAQLSAQGSDTLFQQARGTFSPEQLLVTLNENADLSTFLHESGHFFLEVLADLASQSDTPQQIRDDMKTVLQWFGVRSLATWNQMTLDEKRPYHERWAESFEQYLFEGKAPSPELQPLFRRFRSWLINVYQSLTAFMRGRNLKVSDEIRLVFNRLVATDEQIAQAEEAAGMLPDFEATNEAIEALQARSLRDLKWTIKARSKALKALEKEAATLRKEVEAEVRAEVEQQPLYKAMNWLKKGETTDPATGDLIKAEKGYRLSTAALAEMYPETMLGRPDLTRLRGMTGKEGLHPDMVADMFGFESGDQLVRAILDAEPIASVIEGITDQRMLERHGDLATPEAREAAANEAVHNEARARSLATELKSQAEMMNQRQDTGRTATNGRAITVNAVVEAAKQFALNLAARRRLKDLKNAAWQHRSAEARAGKRWQQLTAEGKTEEAVQAKRDQLLNNYAAKALQDAQVEVRKTLEFFKRITKGSDEKIVERGRDPDVVNAMRAILAAYDVAPRLEKSALAYMEVVAKNDPAMYSALKPGVDAALLNAKPLTELTLEELRGLNDELRAMWVLAKRSRQMEVDGNLLDIEEAADELVTRMDEIGIPVEIPGERGAITDKQEAGIKLRFALSILTRVEQWAERLDGRFGGPFLRLVFQPVKDAADRYRTDKVAYRKQFVQLLETVKPFLPAGPIAAPELGYTFGNARDSGAAELLHAILHTGNDSNKRKLLLGRGWATQNADGTLDTTRWDAFIERLQNDGVLVKAHYDFAQGVWDLLEQMKPLAQETHRKVFGRYFAEVTANEFTTPFGTYRGGYVPAQTDSRLVKDAKLRELAEGENESMAYAFPAAPSGFTKSRVEYNQPLLLDLRALSQHMDKVLLFSHMQGAVTDVRRLLTNKRVSYALDRIDPGAYEGMLIPWLNRAAKQVVETPVVGDRKLSRFLSAARSRAGMALMFANLSNTFQQITGFSMAAVKVKPGLMLQATAAFIADPKGVKKTVAEVSPYMKDRMLNEVSAMNDAVEEILVNPTLLQQGQAWTQRHAYFMQAAVDNTMSPIIWTAAYNQATAEGQNERDAVRFADSVVRQTQGTTLPEDVSRFETGPGYARLFTQFVSYFNMMANTNATAVSQIVNEMGLRKGAGRLLYVALAGLLVPIWVAEAIAQAFRGGPEDEEDDGWLDDWLMAVFGLGTIRGLVAQVPIAGQAAQLVVNRFNDNPADDKFSLSPAVSLIESAVSSPASVYKAVVDGGSAQKAVRDVATAATLITGLPIFTVGRPLGYLAGLADDRIEPTGPVDLARGLVTGTASPESRQR